MPRVVMIFVPQKGQKRMVVVRRHPQKEQCMRHLQDYSNHRSPRSVHCSDGIRAVFVSSIRHAYIRPQQSHCTKEEPRLLASHLLMMDFPIKHSRRCNRRRQMWMQKWAGKPLARALSRTILCCTRGCATSLLDNQRERKSVFILVLPWRIRSELLRYGCNDLYGANRGLAGGV